MDNVQYFVGYGSYLALNQVDTVITGEYETLVGRVSGYMRVFNLPHGSFRYPVKRNLKGVMNVIPRADKHINVLAISIPNEESWDRIVGREGKMYDKIIVDVHLTQEDRFGEVVQAYMFVGRKSRINTQLYPLPEYYSIVRNGAKALGDDFFEEYLQTTYMQANGAFLSLHHYESNMAHGRRPDDFTSITGLSENIVKNNQGIPFTEVSKNEHLDIVRDYYLEEHAKNIVFNDTTNKLYSFGLQFGKYEFYRGSLGFTEAIRDESIWAVYERGIDITNAYDIFFDTRKSIPFNAIEPVKIVIDREILIHPSLVAQTLAQIILAVINPVTFQPWDNGGTVQMLWRHYMEGLLNSAMSLERQTNDNSLIQPDYVTSFEPGQGTGTANSFLPTFQSLSVIDNEMLSRRELVQFPIQLPKDYEVDYRLQTNKGGFWKQWMWFYSKYDRESDILFSYAKFEETVDETHFIQVLMADVKNRIKYRKRVIGNTELSYIVTPQRNYSTDVEIELVSDVMEGTDWDEGDEEL